MHVKGKVWMHRGESTHVEEELHVFASKGEDDKAREYHYNPSLYSTEVQTMESQE